MPRKEQLVCPSCGTVMYDVDGVFERGVEVFECAYCFKRWVYSNNELKETARK